MGDVTKAEKLQWKPKISFEQLVDEMVESDLSIAMDERNNLIISPDYPPPLIGGSLVYLRS